MTIANGINSYLVSKKQTAEGTKASASGAQIMRRVTAQIGSDADSYSSGEIRVSQQMADTRLGNYRVAGTLNGELSCTTYSEYIAAILRKDFVAGPTTGAETTIAAVSDGFTDSANAFLTDGFQAGMIIRCSGFTTATENNNKNFFVLSATANKLTCVALNGSAIVTQSAGDSVTISATGKRSFVPLTGHTNDFFTFEVQDTDINLYRSFVDCQIDSLELSIPPNGLATIDFGIIGKTEDDPTGSAYFTSPTAQTTTGVLSEAESIVVIENTAIVVCSSFDLSIAANGGHDPVVGSKYAPSLTRGRVLGSGSFAVLLEDDSYLEYFRQGTEISSAFAMASSGLAAADAMSFALPRMKITSATETDGEESKMVECDYELLEYVGTDEQHENTTISIQDTTL